MDTKPQLRDEDLDLIKVIKEALLELGDKPGAALNAKVQDGHDHDLVQIDAALCLPDAFQGKIPLLDGQAAEACQKSPLHRLKRFVAYRTTIVVGQYRS